eukprot:gene17657-biopygen9358
MAAGHHRRQLGIAPGPAGEDIADAIDGHGTARFLAPLHKQVAGLAVEVGQGQAADAALGGGAELGEFHQGQPQTIAVDVLMGGLQNVYGSVHGDLLRQ